MGFSPAVLHPEPDPFIVRELKKIDSTLRATWGFSRYFLNRFVIERKMNSERYAACYASWLASGEPRYIDQPIYDDNQPIYENDYERECDSPSGYVIVGYNRFDLAPEWEWVMTIENPDRTFRPLDQRTILELKRIYAWERFHSITRLKMEKQRERDEAEARAKKHRCDDAMDALLDQRRQLWKLPFVGQASTVMPGTEISKES